MQPKVSSNFTRKNCQACLIFKTNSSAFSRKFAPDLSTIPSTVDKKSHFKAQNADQNRLKTNQTIIKEKKEQNLTFKSIQHCVVIIKQQATFFIFCQIFAFNSTNVGIIPYCFGSAFYFINFSPTFASITETCFLLFCFLQIEGINWIEGIKHLIKRRNTFVFEFKGLNSSYQGHALSLLWIERPEKSATNLIKGLNNPYSGYVLASFFLDRSKGVLRTLQNVYDGIF